MSRIFTNAELYNCWPGQPTAEEILRFTALYVGGVRDDSEPGSPDTYCVGCSDDIAQFWTVYVRDGEEWMALTDLPTRLDAEAAAANLSGRWAIPVLDVTATG